MTNMHSTRIDATLGSIEQQEREDERRAAEREAAQTESIVDALTR
jgi:hypothetical protein